MYYSLLHKTNTKHFNVYFGFATVPTPPKTEYKTHLSALGHNSRAIKQLPAVPAGA
jgi:hypothetical protein